MIKAHSPNTEPEIDSSSMGSSKERGRIKRYSRMSNQPAIAINIKEEVLIESGHRCAVCGEGCLLDKARFVSWGKTPEVGVEDVICLCERCHEASERENWSEERY